MRIYLDLDGVFVDFVGGVHAALGLPYSYDEYPYEKGKWNMLGDIGGEFWDGKFPFDLVNGLCTIEFWRSLEWMHDGLTLLHGSGLTEDYDDITILTTPMPNSDSWTGKHLWLRENMPAKLADNTVMLNGSKAQLAGLDTLLIDDRDKNIDEWIAAGGRGLLVPRPWNRAHFCADRTVEVVRNFLEEL